MDRDAEDTTAEQSAPPSDRLPDDATEHAFRFDDWAMI